LAALIHKTARFQVRREGLKKALAAIREFVAYVREHERGATLRYESWQEKEDPTRFVHLFTFRDAQAEQNHSSSAAVKRFTKVLYPLCIKSVEFTDFTMVASTEAQPS
jgi:quinol monooxygenase YgiN